jgi:hypothetical protein
MVLVGESRGTSSLNNWEIPRVYPKGGVLPPEPVIHVLKKRFNPHRAPGLKQPTVKAMKTTMKTPAIISLLTLGLVASSWASPRSKLSYEGPGYGNPSNYRVSSSHSHVWFKHVGPRSKM